MKSVDLPTPRGLPAARRPEIIVQIQAPPPINFQTGTFDFNGTGCLSPGEEDLVVGPLRDAIQGGLPGGLALTIDSACVSVAPQEGNNTTVNRTATTIGIWVPALAENVSPTAALQGVDLIAGSESELGEMLLRVEVSRAAFNTVLAAFIATLTLDNWEVVGTHVIFKPSKGRIDTEVDASRKRRRTGEPKRKEYELRWKETISQAFNSVSCPPSPPFRAETDRRFDRILDNCAPLIPDDGALGQFLALIPFPQSIPLEAITTLTGRIFRSLRFQYQNATLELERLLFAASGRLQSRAPCVSFKVTANAGIPLSIQGSSITIDLQPPGPAVVTLTFEAVSQDVRGPTFEWTFAGDVSTTRTGSIVTVDVPLAFPQGHGDVSFTARVVVRDVDQNDPDFNLTAPELSRNIMVRVLRFVAPPVIH